MDAIMKSFLEDQEREALELSRGSDLVEIIPVGDSRPRQHFLVKFYCKGLVDTPQGIQEADYHEVGLYFPLDYWERANPPEVITWIGPPREFHSNIRFPFLCPGFLTPGTTLVEIVLQCFEIISWQKFCLVESNALNAKACAWARKNIDRFPIDDRPILNRHVDFQIKSEATPETYDGATNTATETTPEEQK